MAKGKPENAAPFKGAKPSAEVTVIRVAETDMHGDKKISNALTKVKGVSWSLANAIIKSINIQANRRVDSLTDKELEEIKAVLVSPEKYGIPSWMLNRQKDPRTGKNMHIVSSDMAFVIKMDVESLKRKRCYRGVRHMYSYKVRGQRTRSRGANVRGRVGSTVGVIKKKLAPQKAAKSEK